MHPINKISFGAGVAKLAIKFYDGSSVVTGYVVKQVGSTKFSVSNMSGSVTKIVRLARTTSELTALSAGTGDDAALRADLGTIEIAVFGGSTENVLQLFSKRAATVQGSSVTYTLGTAGDAAGEGTIGAIANSAPTVANAIPDQVGTVAAAFSYVIPENTFADVNGQTLTLSATTSGAAALSTIGFAFDPVTNTLTKAAATSTVGAKTIIVTASDGTATVSDTFLVTLSA